MDQHQNEIPAIDVHGLLEATEHVDLEIRRYPQKSLYRHGRYTVDEQRIRSFITNQITTTEVLKTLARNRRLRPSTEAGRRIRDLRNTMVQEIEALEIALAHLTSAHREVEPNRRIIECVINLSLENAMANLEQSAAVDSLKEFDTRYATVEELWNALLRHMPEVRHFVQMDLR
ncbi:hypothetical protein ACHAPA_004721 [Fusarium lateritium]